MIRRLGPLVLYEQEGVANGGTLLTATQPAAQPEAGAQEQHNDNANEQNNAENSAKGSLPGWVSALEADLRTNPILKDHAKPSSFVKAAIGWKEKADKAITVPEEGATPEQVAAYRKAVGIPDKPDDYELDARAVPASADFLKAQKELYHKIGIDGVKAKALWEATAKQLKDGVEILRAANKQERDAAEASLKHEYGDRYVLKVQQAQQALNRFATPEFVNYLDRTGLGNNAELIKAFSRIAESIGGDSLLKGTDSRELDIPEARRRFPNSPEMLRT
jgi:hypothetical protein